MALKKRKAKAQKVASEATVLYIRNLPMWVATKLRTHAKTKRQSIAGTVIELVEFAEASGVFGDDASSN